MVPKSPLREEAKLGQETHIISPSRLPFSDKFEEDREDYVDEARAMDQSYYSRIQAMPKYNYLDRDLQLPVQIHKNVQSYRDSPDEGERERHGVQP